MNNVSTKNAGVVLHAVMKRCGFYSYTYIVGEGEGLNESQRLRMQLHHLLTRAHDSHGDRLI